MYFIVYHCHLFDRYHLVLEFIDLVVFLPQRVSRLGCGDGEEPNLEPTNLELNLHLPYKPKRPHAREIRERVRFNAKRVAVGHLVVESSRVLVLLLGVALLLEQKTHHSRVDEEKYGVPGYRDPERLGTVVLERDAGRDALRAKRTKNGTRKSAGHFGVVSFSREVYDEV